MIRIEGVAAVYGEVWYDEEPPAQGGVDIVLYSQRPRPVAGDRCAPFLSLVSDLARPEDAILAALSKECRYEVRRADARDDLRFEFIPEPTASVEDFRRFYDAFAKQKAFIPCDRRWLVSAAQARQLVLTVAGRGGQALVWHAYVLAGQTARLQYSSSHYRDMDAAHRALVGRANRWLHFKDMLRFRALGMRRYDWGGLFDGESRAEQAGINGFKRGFGGQPERTFNCTVPVTVRGRVWLALRAGWRRLAPAGRDGAGASGPSPAKEQSTA